MEMYFVMKGEVEVTRRGQQLGFLCGPRGESGRGLKGVQLIPLGLDNKCIWSILSALLASPPAVSWGVGTRHY